MASNTHFSNTQHVKNFVENYFLEKYGNADNNVINQIHQRCVYLSHEGINLMEQTNLVTMREYNLINDNNINHPLPYHIGFDTEYTGKPLIIAIFEDRNIANNHIFRTNEHYMKITELTHSM